MPDWTYQTLFRPLLFRLPAARARALTLGALHCLGAHQLGPRLIALMGHTRPAPSLARTCLGLNFAAPVLVGAELGGNERALGALARFGVGAVEVGPVALDIGAAPVFSDVVPLNLMTIRTFCSRLTRSALLPVAWRLRRRRHEDRCRGAADAPRTQEGQDHRAGRRPCRDERPHRSQVPT